MTSLIGLSLNCSACDNLFLNVTLVIDIENSKSDNIEKDVIFNQVDIVCSVCKTYLNVVEDDLARDIKTFWEK